MGFLVKKAADEIVFAKVILKNTYLLTPFFIYHIPEYPAVAGYFWNTVYMNDLRTKEGLRTGSPANSLIKQGGEKIKQFIETLREANNIASIGTPLIISIIIVSLYILKNKYNA